MKQDDGPGWRTWIGLGLLAGLAYSLFKHPAGCGCMLVILVVIVVALFAAYWPWSALLVMGVLGLVKLPRFFRWLRQPR